MNESTRERLESYHDADRIQREREALHPCYDTACWEPQPDDYHDLWFGGKWGTGYCFTHHCPAPNGICPEVAK